MNIHHSSQRKRGGKRGRSAVMLVVAALSAAACATQPETSDRDLRRVDAAEVQARIESGDAGGPVLVDVRPAPAFEAGRLPGAIRIPLPELSGSDPRLAGAASVILYGRDARDPLAAAGAKKLHAQGLESVVLVFTGGFDAWRHEDRPIERTNERAGGESP